MVRFQDALWATPIQKLSIVIVGVGGIGSYLAFFLARCGMKLTIIDNDIVDSTNSSGQLYPIEAEDSYKVSYLQTTLNSYCPFNENEIQDLAVKLTENNAVNLLKEADIVISAVDSITTRKLIFETCKELKTPIFIDGRMSAETYQIYFVDSEERQTMYETTLFSEEEGVEPLCAYKATSHVGAAIGSTITQWIANKTTNNSQGFTICATPFSIEYNGFNFQWIITS